jgi:hypothetical protein
VIGEGVDASGKRPDISQKETATITLIGLEIGCSWPMPSQAQDGPSGWGWSVSGAFRLPDGKVVGQHHASGVEFKKARHPRWIWRHRVRSLTLEA